MPPLLLPTPRSVTLTGGAVRARVNPDVIGTLDAGAVRHAEGYRLTISDPSRAGARVVGSGGTAGSGARGAASAATGEGNGGVTLAYATEAGLRHGRTTLRQLVRQYGEVLPCVVIEDEPAFAHRGVMLDVSRDKVPTMASLREYVGSFAAMKLNHVQLYTEHTFAYEGHEEVWLDCSPVTPGEARELDEFAARLGVTLAPNQNCFGHLHKWMKLEKYAHLAETHGEWVFMEWPRWGPFSLCPGEAGSIELVRDMLRQLTPCFRAGVVNVGCDETFDIGQGRSKGAVEARGGGERGRAAVYFDFVKQVAQAARDVGKRPMLWADIALSHPEMLGEFPEGAIGLAWGYEVDSDFSAWCDRMGEHGIEAWVCPGTSSWRSITGRTRERRANVENAGAARKRGAVGYLMTDWGDMGHHQQWPIALNAIAQAAQEAWNPGVPVDVRAVALHVFGDESLETGAWLDRLGDVDAHIRLIGGGKEGGEPKVIRNATALFRDLHRADPLPDPIPAPMEAWERAAANLTMCEETVPGTLERESLVGREIAHTLATARLAVEHAMATRGERGLAGRSPEYRAWLVDLARQVHRELESLWLVRNRVGGLSRSSWHYQKIVDRVGGR